MATRNKNRRRHSHRRPNLRPNALRFFDEGGPKNVFEPVDFDITSEPMDDPAAKALPDADIERLNSLTESALGGRAAACLAELEEMRAKYPHIPKLWNYLSVAYIELGRNAEAERIIEETYRHFPNYLFGFCNYMHLLMRSGRLDEADRTLAGRMSVRAMYPQRRVFHTTEVATFFAMIAELQMRRGNLEAARANLSFLRRVAPTHHSTRYLDALLRRASPLAMLRRLVMRSRSRTLPASPLPARSA